MSRRLWIVPASIVAIVMLGSVQAGSTVAAKTQKNSVAGSWSGTWKRTSAPQTQGTMTLTLTQKGATLSGNETVVGSACLTNNSIAGTLRATSITFRVAETGITASYKGTVSGHKMSGSLQVTCGAAKGVGTFSLSKK